MKPSSYYTKVLILFVVSLCLAGCGTQSTQNIEQSLINLQGSIPAFQALVTAFAYVGGLAFVFKGIFKLKKYGEMRTMMSGHADLKGALIVLFIGTVLIYYPSLEQSMLLTLFNDTAISPLEYSNRISLSYQAYQALLMCVQLVGSISFIRGWFMLSHLAEQSQQNTLGKALTHIIGGIMAINIQGTINVIQGTLGIT